jgi:hypothetical protein
MATLEKKGGRVFVTASVVPGAGWGPHFGVLIVRTSSSLSPELRIPIRGRIVTDD